MDGSRGPAPSTGPCGQSGRRCWPRTAQKSAETQISPARAEFLGLGHRDWVSGFRQEFCLSPSLFLKELAIASTGLSPVLSGFPSKAESKDELLLFSEAGPAGARGFWESVRRSQTRVSCQQGLLLCGDELSRCKLIGCEGFGLQGILWSISTWILSTVNKSKNEQR